MKSKERNLELSKREMAQLQSVALPAKVFHTSANLIQFY